MPTLPASFPEANREFVRWKLSLWKRRQREKVVGRRQSLGGRRRQLQPSPVVASKAGAVYKADEVLGSRRPRFKTGGKHTKMDVSSCCQDKK